MNFGKLWKNVKDFVQIDAIGVLTLFGVTNPIIGMGVTALLHACDDDEDTLTKAEEARDLLQRFIDHERGNVPQVVTDYLAGLPAPMDPPAIIVTPKLNGMAPTSQPLIFTAELNELLGSIPVVLHDGPTACATKHELFTELSHGPTAIAVTTRLYKSLEREK